MKKYGYIIAGILIGIGSTFIILNFFQQYLNYQDLDIAVKFFSGLGVILTGWGVYWRWNDEKLRNLYERRMQEVYAPLYSIIIKQEVYRFLLKSQVKNIDKISEYPLISVKERQINTHIDGNGISSGEINIDDRENLPNEKYILDTIGTSNKGLVDPELLTVVEMDKTILKEMDNPLSKKTDLNKLHLIIQLEILNKIVDGYNDCIKKIGMDDKMVSIKDISQKLGKPHVDN